MKQKFDEKSNKCVMLGYTFTGYKLWDIKNKRVIFSRDVIFDENSNYLEEQFSSNQDDNSDLKIDPSASEKDSSNQLSTDFRRSERQRKAPDWLKDYELNSAVLNAEKFLNETPSTYNEIFGRPDQFQWELAIKDELNSLIKNNTWEIVETPNNVNIVDCKWVFCIKRNAVGNIERYKARLVA